MTLTLKARFRDGKFEPHEPVTLERDAEVELQVRVVDAIEGPAATQDQAPPANTDPWANDPLAEVIGIGEGPSDLAENLDHYLYGIPRKPTR